MTVRYNAEYNFDHSGDEYTIKGFQFQILRIDESGPTNQSIIPLEVKPAEALDANDDKSNWNFIEATNGVTWRTTAHWRVSIFHLHVSGVL